MQASGTPSACCYEHRSGILAGGNAGEFGHRQGLVCESEWLLCVAGMAPERILGLADGSLVLIEPAVPEPLFTPKGGRGWIAASRAADVLPEGRPGAWVCWGSDRQMPPTC